MVDDQHSSSSSSSFVSETARSFDLGQEGDLLKLLNFIRRGPVAPEQKAGLRDAVLDFSISKDLEDIGQLVSILEPFSVSLIYNGTNLSSKQSETEIIIDKPAVNPVVASQFKPRFGGARPKPIFGSSTQIVQTQVEEVPEVPEVPEVTEVTEVRKLTPVSFTPVSVSHDKDDKKIGDIDISSEPALDPEPISLSEVKPIPKEEPVARAQQPTVQDKDVPERSDIPEISTPQDPIAQTGSKYPNPLERIKEIKQTVNQKVGNPVNLIDANNELGREYMNSLLNAMKTVNAGTTDDVNLAMDRLEAAFKGVEESIISGTTVLPPLQKTKSNSDVSEPVVNEQPKGEPKITQSISEDPIPTSEKLSDAINQPVAMVPRVVSSVTSKPIPASPQPKTMVDSVASKLETQEQAIKNQTQAKVAEIEAKQGPASTDPLMSPEITNGLKQLLNEWRIFKGSGIFGTGPSGIEHPLYKTLSTLSMAAVITSRFEGSTPEIKQSISDYMNGWHYEQGVVHEMNETFEHYLRRIIEVILNRKNHSPEA
jgi:hypothetical protein